jgi:hypothetical protein
VISTGPATNSASTAMVSAFGIVRAGIDRFLDLSAACSTPRNIHNAWDRREIPGAPAAGTRRSLVGSEVRYARERRIERKERSAARR